MSELSQYSCSPVGDDEPAMTPEELERFLPLAPSWSIIQERGMKKLRAAFTFDSEAQVDRFLSLIDRFSGEENHPVEVEIEKPRRRVVVCCSTRKVGGLHPNDFIMAARIDGAWSLTLVGREGDMSTGRPLPRLSDSPKFREVLQEKRINGR